MNPPEVILASSSPFRRELLNRLNFPFKSISPDIDESILPNEPAIEYVSRLAQQKAEHIALQNPGALVIGSDQCAYLDGSILGKPGNHENALKQLQNACGREVVFYTGVSVQQADKNFQITDCIEFRVGFRELSDDQLENYLHVEQPYNCAGSFKSEGYGISLFSYLSGDDPTALVGLPLIRLTSMLEQAGYKVV
jgi:septum formation protein